MAEPVEWPTEDLLRHRARSTPDRTALVRSDGDGRWTYGEFDELVERRAAALADAGVAAGDRVALAARNSVGFVEVLHAAMRLRATLVPLNAELAVPELAERIGRIEPDLLVCDDETETAAVAALEDVRIRSLDESERREVRELGRRAGELPDRPPVTRDWTQLIAFTSGTTADPKAVRLTAGTLVSSATASAFRLGVTREDRWLVTLPMYHVGGLAPVLRSTLYGTTIVLRRGFDADETGEVIREREVTGVSLVPTMLERMLDAGWRPPEALRFVLLGGAPASETLIERCRRQDVPVYPTYGMTETASQVATATPQQAFEHEGTVGQPLVVTDVTVVDEGGDPVEAGETGEVVVDGPTVTPGYLDDERTEEAFGERGLYTGDLGYRDEDGRLWVVGRVDDRIVTGGENVAPSRVADAIRSHPGVEDAAVVGLDDREWGQRVAALVVGEADPSTLEAHCRERLAPFELPKTWGRARELPRTESGTVDREAVRERLRDEG